MSTTVTVPQALRDAWAAGEWRPLRDETAAARTAALPGLLAMLDRFLKAETGLVEFVKESQDFSIAQPHWGFKGMAQMQLNQYAKVARQADLVDEVEGVFRTALPAPTDEDQARSALGEVVLLTQRFVDEAKRLGDRQARSGPGSTRYQLFLGSAGPRPVADRLSREQAGARQARPLPGQQRSC